MKSLIVFLFLAVMATAAPETSSTDPIVGKWRWNNHKVLTIAADATLLTDDGHHGRWEFLPGREVERKYRFIWQGGAFEDAMVMAKDQKSISGKRTSGEKRSGTKLN